VEVVQKRPSSKGAAERFSGDVWVDMIAEGRAPSRLRAGVVRFSPCARTAWHRHAVGQTLHVTEGIGLVQTRTGEVIVLRPGDTVFTPPGEWHWHGADPEYFMTHLAISETSGDPSLLDVEWGAHVTDGEYQNAAPRDARAGGAE
jgi:quercetin dioxygenase-like cupin family protein